MSAVRRIFACVCWVMLASCSRNAEKPVVVLYSSVDAEYTFIVSKTFEERTGIKVLTVTDSEASKSTGIVNRLIAEKRSPVADVFWSGDIMRAALLKRLGLSASYHPSDAADLPDKARDPDGHYTGFAARLRVIVLNKRLLPNFEDVPGSVLDLAGPRYASSSCIANPLYGTTSMHAAALFEALGDDQAAAFLWGFSANGGKMLSSNGEVRRRVAAGDYAFGLTDSDDVNVAILDGKPVAMVIPDQEGFGTLLMPSAAVLIKGAPHPREAKMLIDFLVSDDVEKIMAASSAAHIPLRPSVQAPAIFAQPLSSIRVMDVDYNELARRTEELSDGFLKVWVDAADR